MAAPPSTTVAPPPPVASAEPPRRSWNVDRHAARARAEGEWRKLADPSTHPSLESHAAPEPTCEGDHCFWRMTIMVGPLDARSPGGYLDIDASDGSITFAQAQNPERRWQIDAYLKSQELAERAVNAARALPDVTSYCRALKRVYGIDCVMWVDQMGAETCPPEANTHDDCMWSIYLGELQPTHAVRYATLLLRPPSFTLLAVIDTACGPLAPSIWSKHRLAVERATLAGRVHPDCPEVLEDPR